MTVHNNCKLSLDIKCQTTYYFYLFNFYLVECFIETHYNINNKGCRFSQAAVPKMCFRNRSSLKIGGFCQAVVAEDPSFAFVLDDLAFCLSHS